MCVCVCKLPRSQEAMKISCARRAVTPKLVFSFLEGCFFFSPFFFYWLCIYLCLSMHSHTGAERCYFAHVEVRKLARVDSLPLLCGSWELISEHRAQQQVLLPAELSHCLFLLFV